MRCAVSYFRDPEKREVERREISFRNGVFKSSDKAYWKVVISDEEKQVERNRIEIVRIKEIQLPPRSTIAPLSILRHALGTTIDAVPTEIKKVEETRSIKYVYFFPVDDGIIEEGDLIGVFKIYPINVGSLGDQEFLRSPDIKPKFESLTANITYKDGGKIVREKKEIKETWYSRWNLGEWRMLLADEDVKLEIGDARLVKIKPIELQANTIPVPLYGYRNPFGTVIDIFTPGKPRKIEEKKIITHAVFMPTEEGEIKRNDIIGIMNIYAVSAGGLVERLTPFMTQKSKGNVVISKEGGIRRAEFEHKPFVFRRSAVGYLKPVISAETKRIHANKPEKILVEKIDIPSGSIVQPMGAKNHSFGITIDIEFEEQRFVEEDRVVDYAVVVSAVDGEILRGDMIGVLMQYHVTPLTYPELFIRKYA